MYLGRVSELKFRVAEALIRTSDPSGYKVATPEGTGLSKCSDNMPLRACILSVIAFWTALLSRLLSN